MLLHFNPKNALSRPSSFEDSMKKTIMSLYLYNTTDSERKSITLSKNRTFSKTRSLRNYSIYQPYSFCVISVRVLSIVDRFLYLMMMLEHLYPGYYLSCYSKLVFVFWHIYFWLLNTENNLE